MATGSRISPGKSSMGKNTSALSELEGQPYYHGFRPKTDVMPLLKEVGDFLVRASNNKNQHLIVITVRVAPIGKKGRSRKKNNKTTAEKTKTPEKVTEDKDNGVCNLTVCWEKDAWRLRALIDDKKPPPPGFATILELIAHYNTNDLPQKARLKKPIPKPTWYIKHDAITFNKKDILGSGNFCDVYKGIYNKTEQEKIVVAIKAWHEKTHDDSEDGERKKDTGEDALSKLAKEGKAARESMLSEAQLLSYYKNRHVIHLFGVCCDHLPVLIIMEYCAGGNLEQHLRKQGPNITTAERMLYCVEAAAGMRYLHSKNCIHRDLAARNCLISNQGLVKITDFGLSQLMPEEMKPETAVAKLETNENDPMKKKAMEAMNKAQIPLRWMAPESLVRPVQYSFKTDVWSYGVLIFEIFNNGERPWPDEPNMKKIAHWIRKGEMVQMPAKTPPELKQLVEKKIWAMKPEERPNMSVLYTQIQGIFRQEKLPPIASLTVNTLEGVCKDREEAMETGDIETGDEVTRQETKVQTLLKSKTDVPKPSASDTAPITPTASTDGTRSERNKKKRSDRLRNTTMESKISQMAAPPAGKMSKKKHNMADNKSVSKEKPPKGSGEPKKDKVVKAAGKSAK